MVGPNYLCKPKYKIDRIDLEITKCLSRDCRLSYRDISSIAGITPNAIKERINKNNYKPVIYTAVGILGAIA
jgi:DNA-binding Lrp family transcriptional regulator